MAASVFTGAHACEQLAMASADADDQSEADALLEQAGVELPTGDTWSWDDFQAAAKAANTSARSAWAGSTAVACAAGSR